MSEKLILISNDDGYSSEGIKALAGALSKLGRVVVVAPLTDQSAVSHAMTLYRPLRMKRQKDLIPGVESYSVDGTPTDAVYIAIHHLLKGKKPDLVASGINHGPNLGQDVLYSGTVSAAMEGAFLGIPAVAFSLVATHSFNFSEGAKFAGSFCKALLNNPMPKGSLINVNFPKRIKHDGYVTANLGKHSYSTDVDARTDPRGSKYYWIGGDWSGFEDIENSDCKSISEGKISVTPVEVNLTNKSMFPWVQGLDVSGYEHK